MYVHLLYHGRRCRIPSGQRAFVGSSEYADRQPIAVHGTHCLLCASVSLVVCRCFLGSLLFQRSLLGWASWAFKQFGHSSCTIQVQRGVLAISVKRACIRVTEAHRRLLRYCRSRTRTLVTIPPAGKRKLSGLLAAEVTPEIDASWRTEPVSVRCGNKVLSVRVLTRESCTLQK